MTCDRHLWDSVEDYDMPGSIERQLAPVIAGSTSSGYRPAMGLPTPLGPGKLQTHSSTSMAVGYWLVVPLPARPNPDGGFSPVPATTLLTTVPLDCNSLLSRTWTTLEYG